MKKVQVYNKRTATLDNDNAQSHHQEESKLHSTIIANNGVHAFIDEKVIKNSINKENDVTI